MKNRSDDNECATFIYAHLWLETWYGNEVEINLADLIKLLHTRSFARFQKETLVADDVKKICLAVTFATL